MRALILLILLATTSITFADEQPLRYRGHYTLGHEVNTFCPVINSQCYWISPETTRQQRQQLKQLVDNNTGKAYQSICIVVKGKINRDPEAKNGIGFAASYDGLFTVNSIFGLCDKTSIVTQGDLQHHRWILESINGNNIEAEKSSIKLPEIDFGEQMTVTGNTGCNRFSGRAILHNDQFVIGSMTSTMMSCSASQNKMELKLRQILGSESTITIDDKKNLILETELKRLVYRLSDWVR